MDAVSIAFIIVASLMVVGGVLALIGRYAQVKKWTRVVGRVVTYEKVAAGVELGILTTD